MYGEGIFSLRKIQFFENISKNKSISEETFETRESETESASDSEFE